MSTDDNDDLVVNLRENPVFGREIIPNARTYLVATFMKTNCSNDLPNDDVKRILEDPCTNEGSCFAISTRYWFGEQMTCTSDREPEVCGEHESNGDSRVAIGL